MQYWYPRASRVSATIATSSRVEGHYRRGDVHQIGLLRKLFRLTGSLYLCTDFDHRLQQRAADDRCVKIRWRRLSILLAQMD